MFKRLFTLTCLLFASFTQSAFAEDTNPFEEFFKDFSNRLEKEVQLQTCITSPSSTEQDEPVSFHLIANRRVTLEQARYFLLNATFIFFDELMTHKEVHEFLPKNFCFEKLSFGISFFDGENRIASPDISVASLKDEKLSYKVYNPTEKRHELVAVESFSQAENEIQKFDGGAFDWSVLSEDFSEFSEALAMLDYMELLFSSDKPMAEINVNEETNALVFVLKKDARKTVRLTVNMPEDYELIYEMPIMDCLLKAYIPKGANPETCDEGLVVVKTNQFFSVTDDLDTLESNFAMLQDEDMKFEFLGIEKKYGVNIANFQLKMEDVQFRMKIIECKSGNIIIQRVFVDDKMSGDLDELLEFEAISNKKAV